jgi:hypothetical protein
LIKAKLIGVLEGDHCVGPDAKASRMIEMGIPAASDCVDLSSRTSF